MVPWRFLLFRHLNHYKKRVTVTAPQLPEETVNLWAIKEPDVLAISYFLKKLKEEAVTVLDIGTFVGVSAFFFAHQSKVRRVLSVDPSPLLSEEVMAQYRKQAPIYRDKRVLEVAREALSAFPAQSKKVELREGVVGINEMALVGKELSEVKRVAVPREPLVAFVDGQHSSLGVYQDLLAIYRQNPQALSLVHDCQGEHAPFVQGGVASFLKEKSACHFKLFERLPLGLGTPDLGVVYPQERDAEVGQILQELSSARQLSTYLIVATFSAISIMMASRFVHRAA